MVTTSTQQQHRLCLRARLCDHLDSVLGEPRDVGLVGDLLVRHEPEAEAAQEHAQHGANLQVRLEQVREQVCVG